MNRREFVKAGAVLGAGALLPAHGAKASELRTRHLVVVILGCGARRIDVVGNPARAPFQSAMVKAGTLFTNDHCETVNRAGYLYSEVLTGRDAPSQRPRFPTWNEYVRKKTGTRATDFWMLQGVSYYRRWAWDVKHFSTHPDYGVGYGATSLTMNKLFRPVADLTPRELVDRHVERGLGHSVRERERIEAWLGDVLTARRYDLPSTKVPVIERDVQIGDCQALHLAGDLLTSFAPKILTLQILGLGDARSDADGNFGPGGWDAYASHLRTTDELIGNLWRRIQSDAYLRATTSLIIRPDGGRDGETNRFDELGQTHGDRDAHEVWTLALGPDFKKGLVVDDRVERRDLAPTITYLMSGRSAEHATGRVRRQLFAD